ncbi:MAG: HlyD family efflux transporter periplasmic adaptor subunit [Acidimicrobiales bacterium]
MALLALGGAAVAGAEGDDGGGYRTATAGTHEVAQVLDEVGTLEPVSQASVAFPVAGTVARLDVKVGDTVLVGEELGLLDTAELTRTLHERQASLAQAELVLQKALDGEDVSGLTGGGGSGGAGAAPGGSATGISWDTSGSSSADVQLVALPTASSSTTTSTTPPASTTTAPGAPSTGSADAELRAAQQAVLDAQQAVDRDLAAAQAALDRATEICTAVGTPTDPTTSTTSPPASSADPSDGSGVEACRAALADVLAAQNQVAADQAALAAASSALDALLADRASSGSTGGTGSTPSGSGSSNSSGGTGSLPTTSGGSGSTGGTGSTTPNTASSADLVAYQKAVDAAAAQVAAAEQAVDQARIVSPIGGTVVAVGLAVGDEVSASSDTATVVISGEGGYEVTTHVSVDDVPDLQVGQAATVAPDGTDRTVSGEVVRIGAADTSGSSTTYPVTISLTGDTGDLGNGSVASVAITTDAASRALAVPVSAVAVDGDRHTVTVLEAGETRTVAVEVGAVGQRWVEITSGLDAGDEVVLADLAKALPSSATEAQQQSGAGGQGRFGPGAGGVGSRPRRLHRRPAARELTASKLIATARAWRRTPHAA